MNKKQKTIKYESELDLAGFKVPCYVLEDGTRVLSGRGMQETLKMVDEADEGKQTSGTRLKRYLNQKSLEPFIYKEKKAGHFDPIVCYKGDGKINGYEATTLVDVCDVFLEARKHLELSPRQTIIAEQCEILVRSFAKVGIIALIDEATGYQYERERFELQKILKEYVLKDKLFLKWKETFPLSYYKELFGVYNIPFTAENIKRKPIFIGYLTNELVYKNLPKGKEILKKIKARTPKTKGGYYQKKLHQSLTQKVGREALKEVINTIETLAWASKKDKNKFLRLVKERFHPERDLPFIDLEAMDSKEQNKEKDFDKVLEALSKVPPIKRDNKDKNSLG